MILIIILAFPSTAFAQYSVDQVSSTQRPTFLVGSLPPDDLWNFQKLQIEVLGGGWGNNNLGVTTYYVGNRGGLTIHQTTQGSGSSSFGIKAYANPNGNTDIYIYITQDYPAISIKSFKLPSNNGQLQTIIQQTPVGTDVTPVILPVLITDANGNIALNSFDSRGYKLAINGTVIANSITVKMYSWADYVFKNDYRLPTLTDVKTYIDQNYHLPEIPSEAEIAKNGLNLGEMNRLLMKKVEELTLYMITLKEENSKVEIEQQRKIKSQAVKVKKIEKRLVVLESSRR